MATTTPPQPAPSWVKTDEERAARYARYAEQDQKYAEKQKILAEEFAKVASISAQEERDREALALENAIKNSVPLPVEYKILKPTINGEKDDRTAAEAKLKEMLEDLTPVNPTDVQPDDGTNDGIYVLDMRNLDAFDINHPYVGIYVSQFKDYQYNNIKPSQIVFIKVIRFSFGFFGTNRDEKKDTFKFYAYHPNGDPITCRIQVVEGGKQGYDRYAPTQCVFDLPKVNDLIYRVRLYKPKPNPHDEGQISPDDVSLLEGRQDEHKSKIDEQGGIKKLIEERFKEKGYFGRGKKLRSAKKTSKRRSVKSKPRYYRRSVGSINHRRKKTTRRRR